MKKSPCLKITNYKIKSDKIPKNFDGFKVVHLSDLHSVYIANLSDTINSLSPDIICSTGDMVNDYGSYKVAADLINSLADVTPFYMVTGNHDLWRSDFCKYERDCENVGAIWLRNETIKFWKDDEYITISGTDDPFSGIGKKINANIENSISKLMPDKTFNLLLFHRANLFDMVVDKGFDLVLSGHMHGGQIRIPIVGGVFSPRTNITENSRLFFPQYTGGCYEKNTTRMIVSKGLGSSSIIPRLFNPPEICIIELSRV